MGLAICSLPVYNLPQGHIRCGGEGKGREGKTRAAKSLGKSGGLREGGGGFIRHGPARHRTDQTDVEKPGLAAQCSALLQLGARMWALMEWNGCLSGWGGGMSDGG